MRRYSYSMGQICSACRLISLTFTVAVRIFFFFFFFFFYNRSSDKSFYDVELNLVSYFWLKTEFPRTMEISQKGDIARNA